MRELYKGSSEYTVTIKYEDMISRLSEHGYTKLLGFKTPYGVRGWAEDEGEIPYTQYTLLELRELDVYWLRNARSDSLSDAVETFLSKGYLSSTTRIG